MYLRNVYSLAFGVFGLLGIGCAASGTDVPGIDDLDDLDDPADRTTDATVPVGVDGGPGDPGELPDAGMPATNQIDEVLAMLREPGTTPAQAMQIIDDVSQVEGWPLREATRYLFVTHWSDEAAPSLVGDFNAWDTSTHPVARLISEGGLEVGYVVLEWDGDPAGAKYKWWFGDSDYRSADESRSYTFDEFGEIAFVAPPVAEQHYQRFLGLRFDGLPVSRSIRAYLPAGFSLETAASFRTLLLHDGQNVFGTDVPWGGWQVDQALQADGFGDVIAIAVDNASDRMDAYTHVTDDIGSGSTIGGNAATYVRFLQDRVLPLAREQFGIEAAGDSLMVAGSSLGGLVSLYIALEHASMAGCVAAMSPTLGWGAFNSSSPENQALLTRWRSAGHLATAVYLDSGGSVEGSCADGDGDGVMEDAADSDNYCTTLQLRDALAELGYEFDVDLFHWWEPGAPHNEAAWRPRVPRALAACTMAGWSR